MVDFRFEVKVCDVFGRIGKFIVNGKIVEIFVIMFVINLK